MEVKKRSSALPLFRVRMGPLFAWVCIHKSPLGSMNVIRCFAEDTHWHNTLHLSCQQPKQLYGGVWWRNLRFGIKKRGEKHKAEAFSYLPTQPFWNAAKQCFAMPCFAKRRGQSSKSGQREQCCLCRMGTCVLIFWTHTNVGIDTCFKDCQGPEHETHHLSKLQHHGSLTPLYSVSSSLAAHSFPSLFISFSCSFFHWCAAWSQMRLKDCLVLCCCLLFIFWQHLYMSYTSVFSETCICSKKIMSKWKGLINLYISCV